ncbi:hypothetical protein [Clostridium aciditolerans]|uniref:Uncharacterized protein n=1 Tax=Clostridium aciditolerans TaxID=339861 RepID=A0A934HZD6_9CLOT|nr:hypothetical protein [Clostridium aciditolerans]MBI6872291.1 hypothetical protein [Clostridium aciditolerans]
MRESHSFINERKSEDIDTNEMPYYEGDKKYVDEFDEDDTFICLIWIII